MHFEDISAISLKGCDAQPAKRSLKAGESKRLLLVYGKATKHETQPTSRGDSEKIKGTFEAINLTKGKGFKSKACFVPGELSDILADGIDAVGAVQFAMEIGAEYSDKGNLGLNYIVTTVVPLSEDDPLSGLRDVVAKHVKPVKAVVNELPAADTTTAPKGKGKK